MRIIPDELGQDVVGVAMESGALQPDGTVSKRRYLATLLDGTEAEISRELYERIREAWNGT